MEVFFFFFTLGWKVEKPLQVHLNVWGVISNNNNKNNNNNDKINNNNNNKFTWYKNERYVIGFSCQGL